MVIIRRLRFNEWIRPLVLSSQILRHTSQPYKTLLILKLPISLLVLKIYSSETIYVVEIDEKIAGICLAQIKEKQLLIEGTVVDENYRRQGLSTLLKDAVESKAIELGALEAVTKIEPENKAAIKMALKQGYRKTGEDKMYAKLLA